MMGMEVTYMTVVRMLARADAELLAAQFSGEAWERFTHAHLAAVRAAAAVVAARGRPSGRGAPRTVWEMLVAVAPEMSRWAALFADGARLRAALDAGRFEAVSAARSEQALCDAEDFVDVARLAVQETTEEWAEEAAAPRMLAVRAS
jgi:hypothetical protein